jgi:hypothetical protein
MIPHQTFYFRGHLQDPPESELLLFGVGGRWRQVAMLTTHLQTLGGRTTPSPNSLP